MLAATMANLDVSVDAGMLLEKNCDPLGTRFIEPIDAF